MNLCYDYNDNDYDDSGDDDDDDYNWLLGLVRMGWSLTPTTAFFSRSFQHQRGNNIIVLK